MDTERMADPIGTVTHLVYAIRTRGWDVCLDPRGKLDLVKIRPEAYDLEDGLKWRLKLNAGILRFMITAGTLPHDEIVLPPPKPKRAGGVTQQELREKDRVAAAAACARLGCSKAPEPATKETAP